MSQNTAIFVAACLSLSLITAPTLADDSSNKVLTVYTYDSFVSDWGMGPLIKPTFEQQCACTLNLVGMDDAVAMLQRLKLEGASSPADLVLGLDLNLVDDAKKSGLFTSHSVD